MDQPYPVILDRIFYWQVRTTRDRNRYAPKGAPRCPIQGIMMDSKAFHAVGRIPKVIKVRIEALPDDYSDDAPSTNSAHLRMGHSTDRTPIEPEAEKKQIGPKRKEHPSPAS